MKVKPSRSATVEDGLRIPDDPQYKGDQNGLISVRLREFPASEAEVNFPRGVPAASH